MKNTFESLTLLALFLLSTQAYSVEKAIVESSNVKVHLLSLNEINPYIKKEFADVAYANPTNITCKTLDNEIYQFFYDETLPILPELHSFIDNQVTFFQNKINEINNNSNFIMPKITVIIRTECFSDGVKNPYGIGGDANHRNNLIQVKVETSRDKESSHFLNRIANNKTVFAHEVGHLINHQLGIRFAPLDEGAADFLSYLYTGYLHVGSYPVGDTNQHIRDYLNTSKKTLKSLIKNKYSFLSHQGNTDFHFTGEVFRDALILIAIKYSPEESLRALMQIGKIALDNNIDAQAAKIKDFDAQAEYRDIEYRKVVFRVLRNYKIL